MEICENYYKLIKTGSSEESVKFFLKNYNTISKHMSEFINSLDEHNYCYLVTFTLRPEAVGNADEAEIYIKKQFTTRPSLQVREAHVVRELTKLQVPHWHVSVRTRIPLKKDRFQYYEKLYGRVDISKNKAQNLEDGLNYISKSNTPEKLVSGNDLTLPDTQKGTKDYSRAIFLDFD